VEDEMGVPRFSKDVRPLADLKARSSEIVDQVLKEKRPVLLTRRGRGVAVIVELAEYERLVDVTEFIDAVQKGAASAASGDLHSNDEAMSILDSIGKPK
jgi:antitoxin YefM